jgi:hypothetical protein
VSNFTDFGNLFLILSAIPAVVSVIVFARVTWWRSRWGRHLMAYMSAMAFVLMLGVVRIFFADTWWFFGMRMIGYAALVIVLWWRMFYVIQAAREGSPDESLKENREQ